MSNALIPVLAVILATEPTTSRPTAAGLAAPRAALPADPLLAQLVSESLTRLPELEQTELLIEAEREATHQAGALADPSVSMGLQNDGFTELMLGHDETSYLFFTASQSFPWPGKRGLRTTVSELGVRAAERRHRRAQLTAESSVWRAYVDLLLVRERRVLVERLASLWEQADRTARARYESGSAAQSDVLRAQLERSRTQQRRWAIEAEERLRAQGLNRLAGRELTSPLEPSAKLRELPLPVVPSANEAAEDALSRSPELALSRLEREQATASVALARRELYPDLAVTLGVMPRGGELPVMWQAGLSFTLPVWASHKQLAAIRQRERFERSRSSGEEALRQVLLLRVEERRTALAALLRVLELYRTGLLVQSKATADSTLAQYSVGKVSFGAALEAIVGYVGDEDAYLQALADAQRLAILDHEVSLEATPLPTGLSSSAGRMGSAGMSSGAIGTSAAGPSSPSGAATESSPARMGGM